MNVIMYKPLFIIGFSLFWFGFHMVDLAHNEMNIETFVNNELKCKFTYDAQETSLLGKTWELDVVYRIGLFLTIIGVITIIGGTKWKM